MTTDRDAFLRAIASNDEEDAPRLVFADWLDEHGEAERAEFIRLQCRLAQQTVPDTAERMRAADLLDGHHHEWRREFTLGDREGISSGEFERGFVGWVEVDTLDDFRANADLLRASTALRIRLSQVDERVIPPDWPDWPELAGVRGWAFSFRRSPPAEVRRLVGSPHLTSLRSLAIRYSEFDSESLAVLADTPALVNLLDLDLTNHLVDADGVRLLARSPYLRRLRSLNLSHSSLWPEDNRFDTEAVFALASAPNLSSLRRLHLCPLSSTEEASAALANSPHLMGVRWLGLAFDSESARWGPLLGSPLLLGLECLDLSEHPLTPTDAQALFASPAPPDLRSLSLDVEHCGIAGVQALLASPWSAGLTELIFTGLPRSSDSSAIAHLVAQSDSLIHLVRLDMGYLSLNDQTLTAVANSPMLNRLVSLRWYTAGRELSPGIRVWATMTGLPALRRLELQIWPPVDDYPHWVLGGITDSPLTDRLTHLNTSFSLDETAEGWRDRARWTRLRRLSVRDATPQMRAIWGNVLDVRPHKGTVYHSEE